MTIDAGQNSAGGNIELEQLYQGLQSIAEDSLPKTCPNCGKTFATAEDFQFRETRPVFDSSGLRACLDDEDRPVVELFRNCTCGSTLVEVFRDRSDRSPAGKRRRRKFGHLLRLLNRAGIGTAVARLELLKILRGGQSEILERRGFQIRTRRA